MQVKHKQTSSDLKTDRDTTSCNFL
uniref:Uncharacterized protein n=1 Tax=Anguilla anguilla TaxID=7936 RepID=A0A0E9TB77_ANGAN